MFHLIRSILLFEAISFFLAGLAHSGVVIDGYQHRQAATAETLIGLVLLAGLVPIWLRPSMAGRVGLFVQGVALLGTLVGAFTIAIGVGPRTVPDIAFHAAILLVLCGGLLVATRSPNAGATRLA